MNIERAQAALRWPGDFFGQQNSAGTSAERRFGADEIGQLLEESVLL